MKILNNRPKRYHPTPYLLKSSLFPRIFIPSFLPLMVTGNVILRSIFKQPLSFDFGVEWRRGRAGRRERAGLNFLAPRAELAENFLDPRAELAENVILRSIFKTAALI